VGLWSMGPIAIDSRVDGPRGPSTGVDRPEAKVMVYARSDGARRRAPSRCRPNFIINYSREASGLWALAA